jgi:hypothetical protein
MMYVYITAIARQRIFDGGAELARGAAHEQPARSGLVGA